MRIYCTEHCSQGPPLSPEKACLANEVECVFSKLKRRYGKISTTRQRLWELSRPKCIYPKYQNTQSDILNRQMQIQMLYHADKWQNTRTELLALPPVRVLEQLKLRPAYKYFSNIRRNTVNRNYRKSLFSFYSRLQNVQPPNPIPKLKKRKPKTARLRKLAMPKPDFSKKKLVMGKKQENVINYRRLRRLSRPRKHKEDKPVQWELTAAAKYFKPSQRLLKIARPKEYEVFDENELFKVKPIALSYNASQRILDLAQPKKKIEQLTMIPEKLTYISPNALKAKASKRTEELAEPREYSDVHNKPDPFKISETALKFTITPRLKALAEPKKYSK